MKKLILFAAIAILMTTAINAQIRIGEMNTNNLYILPAELTSNGVALLYSNSDSISHFYDNNLNNIANIQRPEGANMYINYANIDNVSAVSGRHVFTQTLFNNDPEFEYLRYTDTIVIREVLDQYWNHTEGYITKIEAVNLSGNVLFSIDAPTDSAFGYFGFDHRGDFQHGDEGISVRKWGGSFYLVVNLSSTDSESCRNYKYVWYRINQQTQSVTRINGNLPLNVFPTIADCSQTITVELGEGNNASEVQVVNAVGQVVKQISLQPGQRKVQIRASDLGSGMHIVGTRSRDGQGACKIIVK